MSILVVDRRLLLVIDMDELLAPDRLAALREAIIGPLRNIYGVSDKVLAMALSNLLSAAGSPRPLWVEVGATFVAVDTLVHNFLHRTGILKRRRSSCVHTWLAGAFIIRSISGPPVPIKRRTNSAAKMRKMILSHVV